MMSVMKVCCEVVRHPSNELWEFDETRIFSTDQLLCGEK
jgi:hypothetical protein